MTRKTSAYARKRRHPARQVFNGVEWVNTIQRCASYGDLPAVAGFETDTQVAAVKAQARVQGALESLLAHTPPADVEKLFDTLSHALNVASIRAEQIQPDAGNNPALDILHTGSLALLRAIERWTSGRGFGLDAQGRIDLPPAIDVYVEILRASSPAQMVMAIDIRLQRLQQAQKGD